MLHDFDDFYDWCANMEVENPDAVSSNVGEFPIAALNIIKVPFAERGQGKGKQMLAQFEQAAKVQGANGILLVSSSMDKQRKGFDLNDWYLRQGFEDIGSTTLDTSVMYKRL
jgi:N-acetylglutamate synthase-like GNAT family acetyltransferase